MSITLPPGFKLLLSILPRALLPPTLVLVATKLIRSHLELPSWLVFLSSVLSLPVMFTMSLYWKDWMNRRAARAQGAVMPPMISGRLPGSVDLLKVIKQDHECRFPGYRIFERSEQYGHTYNFRVYFENRIIVTEPEYIKIVLATDFAGYEKGPEFRLQFNALLGTGVFNSDGEMWKFHRAMTRPFFSRDRISHFDIFDRHAEDALNLIKERTREGYPIDWQDLVSRFTLDSATEFLFGLDVRSLSAGLPYPPSISSFPPLDALKQSKLNLQDTHPANIFAQTFLRAQVTSTHRGRYGPMWPLFEFWKDKVKEQMKVIDQFIEPLLTEALSKKTKMEDTEGSKRDGEDQEEEETLLAHLINLTDDPQIIRDETLNILLAGRDTTAMTLTAAVYMLALHPDMLATLRAEVLEKVDTRRPSYDDIRDMKYLRAFINAMDFDPDRFLDERLSKYLTSNPFIFLPFNAGPRICLGQQFAYNEVSFMLIRLVQQFSSILLVQKEANPEKMPPPGWAESKGSNGKDQVRIRAHLTMFVD
ncbi:hypothetical protein PHLCEN_2v9579, partial [Hermanssonia centrifuga]